MNSQWGFAQIIMPAWRGWAMAAGPQRAASCGEEELADEHASPQEEGGGVHKVHERTTGELTGKKKNRKWGRIQMRNVTDIVYHQWQWGKGDFKKHVDRKKSFYLKI